MTTIVTRAGKGSPLTNTEVDTNFTNLNSAKLENTNNLSDVSNTATARTNLGLAIGTNVQAWDADLDAIAALVGTTGLLKKTAANTWTLDTSAYLTANQSITLSGDATGSGTTAIAVTLANSGATAGTYTKVTVDAKGRVTVGASLASSDVTTALGYTPLNPTTSQTANFVYAAPNGAAGAPTFRALVAADIPALSYAPTAGSTSITTLGTIGTGTWQGSIISPTYGGTGINNGTRTLAVQTNSGTVQFSAVGTTLTVSANASISGTNTGDQTITLTGDVTGSGTSSFAATLANSGVTAGGYGSSSAVPVLTIDAKGRVTAASTAAISAGITISDDTTTNATRYPVFEDVTSGSSSAAQVSSTKLTFNPSTGTLSATVMTASSDETLKTNWRDLPDLIEGMAGVKHGEFDWLDGSGTDVGVSAQALMQVLATAVKQGDQGRLSVNYGSAALVTCIQLCKRIVEMETKLRQAGVYM